MKNFSFKAILPHIVALVLFLLLSLVFTKPALEGKVLEQHDVQQWKAMAQQSFEFKEKHGFFPRWSNSMFCGMPAYQIALSAKTGISISSGSFVYLFTLGLPKPVYYLFIACSCFYLLCIVIGINPWLSILGGIAYGYCSYDPILIAAGHDTKILSMAYVPGVIASMVLIFNRKYWLGGSLLLIFGGCLIGQSHQQIVYYTLIMALCIIIFLIIKTAKGKDFKHLFISVGLTGGLAAIALLLSAEGYFATYEYSKESMRGGSELTSNDTNKENKTVGGLDKDYAFSWSYGKAESLTFLVPNAFGGGSSTSLGDESKVVEVLQQTPNIPEQMAQQLYQAASAYWGEQPSTSGPVYFGAIICLLFVLGIILSESEHKWWLLTITVIGLLLSYGKNLEGLNYFLFDHLPFYNKFRTPSMSLVIVQFAVPLLGVIFLNELVQITDKEKLASIGNQKRSNG
ncbi:MAG: hypothetical protein HY305_05200 [Sphingobacteriales bacterium]|nr:hypothetical protein [Sphingobacteriales bacterium]